MVVKGPNCLIGRHSLARLWPQEFERFRKATCANYKAFTPEQRLIIEAKQFNIVQPVDSNIVNSVKSVNNVQLNINSVKNVDKSVNSVSMSDQLKSKSTINNSKQVDAKKQKSNDLPNNVSNVQKQKSNDLPNDVSNVKFKGMRDFRHFFSFIYKMKDHIIKHL